MRFMKGKEDRTARRQGGLMKNSIHILEVVCLMSLAAFILNYVIIQRWYRDELVEMRRDFFARTFDAMEDMETNILKIADSINSNSSVISYINADVLGERWDELDNTKQFSASLMMLDDTIVAVSIYNAVDELIAMQGTKYSPIPVMPQINDSVYISDRVQISGENEYYFQVIVPVYERTENSLFSRAGSVAILFDTGELGEIAGFAVSAYSEEDNYIAVLDKNNEVLDSAGNGEVWTSYMESSRKEKDYLYFSEQLPNSGWSLVYVTRKSSYMYYMNQVQIVNILMYAVIILVLSYSCYMMYYKVIRPIKKQLAFVVNFTKDTSKRLEVWDKTEFGELEKEINEMLDGIEELNKRIIEDKEHYLQLEYSKKQTEIIAYKNQINPHFMHNTLECIRGMALYRGEKEIAKITAAMSRMFEYNVRGNEIVTVKEMLRAIRDYAVLIEYRFMGKIKIIVQEMEGTECIRLPKMLVQPFVENAVQHGLEPKVESGSVRLEISEMENRMRVIIEDDGIGMDHEELERQRQKFSGNQKQEINLGERHGIGVKNVARRLWLFYGEEYQIKIYSEMNIGTTIILELPKQVPADVEKNKDNSVDNLCGIQGEEAYVSGVFGRR